MSLVLRHFGVFHLFMFTASLREVGSWSSKCVFVGYSSTQKGYKCYHHLTKIFLVFADVIFVETEPYFTHPSLQRETSSVEDKDELLLPNFL